MKCRQFIEKPRQVEKPYQKRCGAGWGGVGCSGGPRYLPSLVYDKLPHDRGKL